MATVVVIGAGLGGLPAAYELRHHLSDRHQVILVSDENKFTFIPGLIQVALNLKPLEHIQLNLERLTKTHHLTWMSGKVLEIEPTRQRLTIEGGKTIDYDYAVIATGASLAFDQIPGLGPHTGYTHSVCTPSHAMAIAVAHNIAVQLGDIRRPLKVPTLEALCFAEYGETGIAYVAAPVIPDFVTGERQTAYAVKGRWVKWVKMAFEDYFMLKMKFGVGVPWFEQIGLQALFGLSLTKFLSATEHIH